MDGCLRQKVSPARLIDCPFPTNLKNFLTIFNADVLSISADRAYRLAPKVQKRVCSAYICIYSN